MLYTEMSFKILSDHNCRHKNKQILTVFAVHNLVCSTVPPRPLSTESVCYMFLQGFLVL